MKRFSFSLLLALVPLLGTACLMGSSLKRVPSSEAPRLPEGNGFYCYTAGRGEERGASCARTEPECASRYQDASDNGALDLQPCMPRPEAVCTAVFTDPEHVTWHCFGDEPSCTRYWPGTSFDSNMKQSECVEAS